MSTALYVLPDLPALPPITKKKAAATPEPTRMLRHAPPTLLRGSPSQSARTPSPTSGRQSNGPTPRPLNIWSSALEAIRSSNPPTPAGKALRLPSVPTSGGGPGGDEVPTRSTARSGSSPDASPKRGAPPLPPLTLSRDSTTVPATEPTRTSPTPSRESSAPASRASEATAGPFGVPPGDHSHSEHPEADRLCRLLKDIEVSAAEPLTPEEVETAKALLLTAVGSHGTAETAIIRALSSPTTPPRLLAAAASALEGKVPSPPMADSLSVPSPTAGSPSSDGARRKSSRTRVRAVAPEETAAFVSHAALRCFELDSDGAQFIVPRSDACAVLFIDISGYSRVAKALEAHGAYVLSKVVNAYLEKILTIVVDEFRGDPLKFAGDAIMVMWAFPAQDEQIPVGAEAADCPVRTKRAVQLATRCALALLERCGEHPVEGTEHTFRLHIGLTCGACTTSVFETPHAARKHQEQYYAYITGRPLKALGSAVDTAKAGQLCLTGKAAHLLGPGCDLTPAGVTAPMASMPTSPGLAASGQPTFADTARTDRTDEEQRDSLFLVESVGPEALAAVVPSKGEVESLGEFTPVERAGQQVGFVPPRVMQRLANGVSSNQMAEMRLLAVLFIHCTDPTVHLPAWLSETQAVCDAHRCSVVQIIDDDKGIHVVAAVNLHAGEREAAPTAVQLCQALIERDMGSTIGVACGVTFCGVVGSGGRAARWDITGATVVRACRVMQHALSTDEPVLLDDSVLQYAADRSLVVEAGSISVKGSPEPFSVYKLALTTPKALNALTDAANACQFVHEDIRDRLRAELVADTTQRKGALLVGVEGAGKTFIAVTALGSHVSQARAKRGSRHSTLHESLSDARPRSITSHPSDLKRSASSSVVQRTQSMISRSQSRPGLRDAELRASQSGNGSTSSPRDAGPAALTTEESRLVAATASCRRNAPTDGFVLMMHTAVENAVEADLLWTLARWNTHHWCPFVAGNAAALMSALVAGHRVRMLRSALHLVESVVSTGSLTAVLVSQAQFLDDISATFIREVLTMAPSPGTGRFLVVATLVPQPNGLKPAAALAMLGAGAVELSVGELNPRECSALINHRLGWASDPNLATVIQQVSGSLPACIDQTIHMIQRQRPYITQLSRSGVVRGSEAALNRIRSMPWPTISPAYCAKIAPLYGALAPAEQTLVKSAAVLDTGFLPAGVALAAHVMRSVLGIPLSSEAIEEMAGDLAQLHVIRAYSGGPLIEDGPRAAEVADGAVARAVEVGNPALRDVVLSGTTPEQQRELRSIAVECFEQHYSMTVASHFFARGELRAGAGDEAGYLSDFRLGRDLLQPSSGKQSPSAMHSPNTTTVGRGSFSPLASPTDAAPLSPEYAAGSRRKGSRRRSRPTSGNLRTEGRGCPAMLAISSLERRGHNAAAVLGAENVERWTTSYAAGPLEGMSLDVVAVKNYMPPIALGPIACHVLELAWGCRTLAVAAAHRDAGFSDSAVPPEYIAYLSTQVDTTVRCAEAMDAYYGGHPGGAVPLTSPESGDLLADFQQPAPTVGGEPFTPPRDIAEERALLCSTFAADGTYDETVRRAQAFLAYTQTTLEARAWAARGFAKSQDLLPPSPSAPMVVLASARAGLELAYKNAVLSCEAAAQAEAARDAQLVTGPACVEALEKAMMTLALVNYRPDHPKLSMQHMRNWLLRLRREPVAGLRAFIFFEYVMETTGGCPRQPHPTFRLENEATAAFLERFGEYQLRPAGD